MSALKDQQIKWWEHVINVSNISDNKVIEIDSKGLIVNDDCFHFLKQLPNDSIDAIVTDPPYGVKEYDLEQIEKMKNGNGGVWRIPPSFDGNLRSPLPRFTSLNQKEIQRLKNYFEEFGKLIAQKLKPGGHAFIASNSFLSIHVFGSISNSELQFRVKLSDLLEPCVVVIDQRISKLNSQMFAQCLADVMNLGGYLEKNYLRK